MMHAIDEDDYHARVKVRYVHPIAREQAWWRSDSGHLLGILLLDLHDQDWAYVILGRDTDGVFKAIDMAASFNDREVAEQELLDQMGVYDRMDVKVFDQNAPRDWMKPVRRKRQRR